MLRKSNQSLNLCILIANNISRFEQVIMRINEYYAYFTCYELKLTCNKYHLGCQHLAAKCERLNSNRNSIHKINRISILEIKSNCHIWNKSSENSNECIFPTSQFKWQNERFHRKRAVQCHRISNLWRMWRIHKCAAPLLISISSSFIKYHCDYTVRVTRFHHHEKERKKI